LDIWKVARSRNFDLGLPLRSKDLYAHGFLVESDSVYPDRSSAEGTPLAAFDYHQAWLADRVAVSANQQRLTLLQVVGVVSDIAVALRGQNGGVRRQRWLDHYLENLRSFFFLSALFCPISQRPRPGLLSLPNHFCAILLAPLNTVLEQT
jgi:hypothetical protein